MCSSSSLGTLAVDKNYKAHLPINRKVRASLALSNILMNYPKDLKAFYMRLDDEEKTVAAMDVLVLSIGAYYWCKSKRGTFGHARQPYRYALTRR